MTQRTKLFTFILLLTLMTAACNLTRATSTLPPAPTVSTTAPTFPPGTFVPSVTPFDLTPPTPGGSGSNCPPPNGWVAYQVETGDTIGSLAEATGTTVDAIVIANCLTDQDNITIGQTIYLPTDPVVG